MPRKTKLEFHSNRVLDYSESMSLREGEPCRRKPRSKPSGRKNCPNPESLLKFELLGLSANARYLQLLCGLSCQMSFLQIVHQSLIFCDQLWASSFSTLDFKQSLHRNRRRFP